MQLMPEKPIMQRFFCRVTVLLAFLLAALLATAGALAETAKQLPIAKGINLSSWLANAPRQPVFQRDFLAIRRAGFDHVRLPVNPEQFGFQLKKNTDGMEKANFSPVDRAISMSVANDLPVLLNIHPRNDFMKTLEENEWAEEKFIRMWAALAARYKNHPADKLAFELLNEPQYYDSEKRYYRLLDRLVAAIRKEDKDRTLIVGGPYGSSINGLLEMEPVGDPNVIYAFHFYEPYIITHQGIHQGFKDKMVPHFRKLPYPSSMVAGDAKTYAPKAPDPEKAGEELQEYTDADWNAERIGARIKEVKEWADKHKARVICSEFGVLRNHIDPASRYRWIEDARAAFETNGFAWELWDYADIFGIAVPRGKTSADPVDGAVKLDDPMKASREIEAAAVKALGLKGR